MNNSYANSSKQTRLFQVVLLILFIMSSFIISGCGMLTLLRHKGEVQQHMKAHLKDQYGIAFDVNPYLVGGDWTGNYVWEADAHPTDQPQIKFNVKGEQYTQDLHTNSGSYYNDSYSDNYLQMKWSYQAKQEIEKKLKEVYGADSDIIISEYEIAMKNKYAFKDLNYAQVFEKTHGQGVIHLYYDIFMDSTQFNKEEEIKKAYQLMKPFVLDYGSDCYTFIVRFIDKSFKPEYLKDRHFFSNKKGKQGEKLLRWFRIFGSSNPVINNSSDLANYI